jgi:hypothetical protein
LWKKLNVFDIEQVSVNYHNDGSFVYIGRIGVSDESELHQYVLYDTVKPKGPRIIKLDDDSTNKYRPPNSLVIHLSKIPMPELQPKPTIKTPSDPALNVEQEHKSRKDDRKGDKKGRKILRP